MRVDGRNERRASPLRGRSVASGLMHRGAHGVMTRAFEPMRSMPQERALVDTSSDEPHVAEHEVADAQESMPLFAPSPPQGHTVNHARARRLFACCGWTFVGLTTLGCFGLSVGLATRMLWQAYAIPF